MSSQKMVVQKFEADIVEKVKDYLNQYFAHQVRVLGTRIGLWRYGALRKALPEPAILCPDIDLLLGSLDVVPDWSSLLTRCQPTLGAITHRALIEGKRRPGESYFIHC